jgi:hypothetical protein
MKKLRNGVRERSAAAVAKAGSRVRGEPVQTAGRWREQRGRLKEGPFRPGKSKAERRGGG